MELKTFFAQDLNGTVIPSPTVTVYQPGTTTLATGLQNASGGALTNPFTGGGNGQVVLAAPDGDYDIRVEGAGRTTTMRVRFIDSGTGTVQILRDDLASAASGKGASLVKLTSGRTVQEELDTHHVTLSRYVPAAVVPTAIDCSAYLQAAANQAATLKVPLHIDVSCLLSGRTVIPPGLKKITGSGRDVVELVFDRAQTGIAANDCAIFGQEINGCTISGFALRYTGEFYRVGESYFGTVNGLYVVDSNSVVVEGLKVSGFNSLGVYFGSKDRPSTNLSRSNKVTRCLLRANRVGGLGYGYQNGLVVEDNDLEENGHVADGGTGYGVAAISGTPNRSIRVVGNRTYRNYRKGIDIHDCISASICDNVCDGDRLFGIWVETGSHPIDRLAILNNEVRCDPSNYLATDDDAGSVYRYLYPIGVYINPGDVPAAGNCSPSINIVGNTVTGAGSAGGAYEIYGISVTTRTVGRVRLNITRNTIEGTNIKYPVLVSKITGQVMANISANEIEYETLTSSPIQFGGADLNDHVTIVENDVAVTTVTGSAFVTYSGASVEMFGNTLNGARIADYTRSASGSVKKSMHKVAALAASAVTVSRVGEEQTGGLIDVNWSAAYLGTAPVSARAAGGSFRFSSAFGSNGQTSSSAFSNVEVAAVDAGPGPAISITWSLNIALDPATQTVHELKAQSSVDCNLLATVTQTRAIDTSTVCRII